MLKSPSNHCEELVLHVLRVIAIETEWGGGDRNSLDLPFHPSLFILVLDPPFNHYLFLFQTPSFIT